MFDGLTAWLGTWFAKWWDVVQGWWDRGKEAVLSVRAIWAALVLLVVGLVTNSKQAWQQVTGSLADITAPAIGVPPAAVVSWLNVGNTVFPLAESLGYVVAWLALYVACKVTGSLFGFVRGIFG